MSNQDILIAVLKKIDFNNLEDFKKCISKGLVFKYVDDDANLIFRTSIDEIYTRPYEILIYSNWFAKAFWGRDFDSLSQLIEETNGYGGDLLRWQYHLQQMVLEEEPLKYLEKFL